MAQWPSLDSLFKQRFVWPAVAGQCFSPPMACAVLQLVIHPLGGFVSVGIDLPALDGWFRGLGLVISLFGFLVLWLEPIFLGLGDQFEQSLFPRTLFFFRTMSNLLFIFVLKTVLYMIFFRFLCFADFSYLHRMSIPIHNRAFKSG